MKNKQLGLLLLVGAAVGALWYWWKNRQTETTEPATTTAGIAPIGTGSTGSTTPTLTDVLLANISGAGGANFLDTLKTALGIGGTATPASPGGATTPATTTPPVKEWQKALRTDAGNLWFNAATGNSQWTEKGHNPNMPQTLTAKDKTNLATKENEPLTKALMVQPVNVSGDTANPFTKSAVVVPASSTAKAPPPTNPARPYNTAARTA